MVEDEQNSFILLSFLSSLPFHPISARILDEFLEFANRLVERFVTSRFLNLFWTSFWITSSTTPFTYSHLTSSISSLPFHILLFLFPILYISRFSTFFDFYLCIPFILNAPVDLGSDGSSLAYERPWE